MCVIIDLSPGSWLWTLKPLHRIKCLKKWSNGVLCPTIGFLKCRVSRNFTPKTFPLYFRIKFPRTGLDTPLYHSPTLTFVFCVTGAAVCPLVSRSSFTSLFLPLWCFMSFNSLLEAFNESCK